MNDKYAKDLKQHPYGFKYYELNKGNMECFYRDHYHSQRNLIQIWEHNFEENRWWFALQVKIMCKLFKNYCPQAKTLVDIGCGIGNNLLLFKEEKYDVIGIESSVHCCEVVNRRELPVLQGNLNDHICNIGKKDIIVTSCVMEHVEDPCDFLDNIRKLMIKDRSLLMISVPNDFSPWQNMLMEKYGYPPYFLSYPDHRNYFNFESLRKILENKGFSVLEMYGDFPMEFFLLCGRNYVEQKDLGGQCHKERMSFEKSFIDDELSLFNLYKAFATMGIGRIATALAFIS